MIESSYNGNALIKKAGIPVAFTADQVSEWVKCSEDPIYFIENYVKIVTLDFGLQPMKLYDFQKDIVRGILEKNKMLGVAARQLGKTTVMAALFCHYIIFNEDKVCAILANKAAVAREILSRVKLAYEHLPKWLQHGIIEWNKGSIQLENGSRILASATSGSAVRGYTLNFLFLDEFAFVPNNIAEEFFTSVYPTISSGATSKLAIISTPNGMNHFYKMWTEATSGLNGFSHVKAIWSAIPSRTQEWANNQKSVLGEQKFNQEMECEFLGASNTLITGSKLKSIPVVKPLLSNSISSIYERPAKHNKYCMTVDTSRGTGNDYSTFIVFDVTALPYKIVMKYRNNTISSMLYPGVIHKFAMEYNNCPILVETNDIGEGVANALYYDLEYEDTIFSKQGAIVSWGGQNTSVGLRTTTKTKRIGCDTLKQLIETDKLVINDYEVLYELSNFVAKGKSYEADVGNDDLAMCLVMFAYLTVSVKFEEISDDSVRLRVIQERQAQEDSDAMPIGYYSDGSETQEEIFNF